MPIIKSVDCTPQDGHGAFSLSSVCNEPDEEPSYVDGPGPLDEDYEVNDAAMLDMALSDSEMAEYACIDANEIERVHNELLQIYALKAKAKILQKHNHTTKVSVKEGMGSLRSTGQLWVPCAKRCGNDSQIDLKGSLGGIAAMVLMTIMYSARVARYGLLKPVAFLAKRITRWDVLCDKRLHRLICYIHKTQ